MVKTEVNGLDAVKDFIQRALRLGKFPRNTALARLSAIKVVEQSLTEEEPHDLDYISDHLEEIFGRRIGELGLSADSVKTYITRVRSAVSDYQGYGTDHKALLN